VTRFIDTYRDRFGVEPICQALEVSASAYYKRKTGERSARTIEDERLLAVIRQTHEENFHAYGYRKMWKTLRRAGETVPRCQVQRLMAANGICGAKRRGKPWRTTISDPQAAKRPDLVNRDFTASAPDPFGWAISRICAAGRGSCISRSSSTCSAARSSAGSSPRTCAPISSWTRCGWRSGSGRPGLTSRS
jgi:HTH-like domain